jgi:hypothetical protein
MRFNECLSKLVTFWAETVENPSHYPLIDNFGQTATFQDSTKVVKVEHFHIKLKQDIVETINLVKTTFQEMCTFNIRAQKAPFIY